MQITIKCFAIEQPIGTLYVGYIPYNILLDNTEVNVRGYVTNLEKYIGIQRERSETRLKEIARFIELPDSTFPTSIVLHLSSDCIVSAYDSEKNEMILDTDESNKPVFQILDGQHRLFSFKELSNPNIIKYDLPVTIIIDADIDTQAHVFTKINLNQTRVNKSLTYDLYEYAKTNSPYKTAHQIVNSLNNVQGSPFYKKIKMIGKSEKGSKQLITQAAMVDGILKYISNNPENDISIIKKEGFKKYTQIVIKDPSLVFQDEYLSENYDVIAQFFYDIFTIISKKWNSAWTSSSHILSKTTGVLAFMSAFNTILQSNKKLSSDFFQLEKLINSLNFKDDDFTNDKYPSGYVGQNKLSKIIVDSINQSNAIGTF